MYYNEPMDVKKYRKPEHEISEYILGRWSPRAMTGEELTDNELMPLFEAARWAPSSMNNQLWRFIYAKRNTKYFNDFFSVLSEGNKIWCKSAASLVILISRKNAYYKNLPQPTHSFEAGSAFENLALEGARRNLVIHAMAGFDYAKAKNMLKLSDEWKVECMIAIGKPGHKDSLPSDLREREVPTQRIPLNKIAFEGEFKDAFEDAVL